MGKYLHHFKLYRYIRYMLRRYPKMRKERLGWYGGMGVDSACGNSWRERMLAYREKWERERERREKWERERESAREEKERNGEQNNGEWSIG